jgi:hypothetical protein
VWRVCFAFNPNFQLVPRNLALDLFKPNYSSLLYEVNWSKNDHVYHRTNLSYLSSARNVYPASRPPGTAPKSLVLTDWLVTLTSGNSSPKRRSRSPAKPASPGKGKGKNTAAAVVDDEDDEEEEEGDDDEEDDDEMDMDDDEDEEDEGEGDNKEVTFPFTFQPTILHFLPMADFHIPS